jgi:hypothetical protein
MLKDLKDFPFPSYVIAMQASISEKVNNFSYLDLSFLSFSYFKKSFLRLKKWLKTAKKTLLSTIALITPLGLTKLVL